MSTFDQPAFTDNHYRYLLDQTSGPFIDYRLAHQQITFSCLSYLNSNLELVPTCTENKNQQFLERLVVNRPNGLHHYANRFWFDHVLAYLEAHGTMNNHLAQAWEQFRCFWRRTRGPSDRLSSETEYQNQGTAQYCQDLLLNDILQQVGEFRKNLHARESTFESPACKWCQV